MPLPYLAAAPRERERRLALGVLVVERRARGDEELDHAGGADVRRPVERRPPRLVVAPIEHRQQHAGLRGDEDRLRASGEGREARVLPTFRPRRSLFPNSWGTGPYAILILYLMIKLSISEAIHIRYPSSCS